MRHQVRPATRPDEVQCTACGAFFFFPDDRRDAFRFLGFGPPGKCPACRHPAPASVAPVTPAASKRRPMSLEQRAKLSAALKGRAKSPETKLKMREAARRRIRLANGVYR